MTNLAPKLFEAFDYNSGRVVRVGTQRQCFNTAKRFSDMAPVYVRRMRVMQPGDLGMGPTATTLAIGLGFMQPTGYNKCTGRYEYYL